MTANQPADITALNGVVLSGAGAVRRDFTRPLDQQDDDYRRNYDRHTLFYHAFRRMDLGKVFVVAPPFMNLWPHFREGLRINGEPVPSCRRRQTPHCDIVSIGMHDVSAPLVLSTADWEVIVPDAGPGRFHNRNVLMAVNKDNDLGWIRDWARYHVSAHKADAVLLIDNASRRYDPDVLRGQLREVDGIEAVEVISAPFPYGPHAVSKQRGERPAKFLQSAMFNLAALHSLAHARAVLSVDIDEIVLGPAGMSVFDAAFRHPLGLITIRGDWVMPAPEGDGPWRHADHSFRMRRTKRGSRKWCGRPQGVIPRFWPWGVHQMGGALQNWFTENKHFRFAHCWAISTGWKKAARLASAEDVVWDQSLAEQWARHLP